MKIYKSLENMRNILKGETHFIFEIYKYTIYIYLCVEISVLFNYLFKKKRTILFSIIILVFLSMSLLIIINLIITVSYNRFFFF